MVPLIDIGADLVLENGLRLQIKCASLRENNKTVEGIQKNLGYFFELRRGAWLSQKKRYERTTLRSYSEVADYFVLWGIEENRFFIVPTNHKRQRIWFNSRSATSQSRNKRLFDQITADRVRDFEDRWDLLDVNSTSNELIESAAATEAVAQKE